MLRLNAVASAAAARFDWSMTRLAERFKATRILVNSNLQVSFRNLSSDRDSGLSGAKPSELAQGLFMLCVAVRRQSNINASFTTIQPFKSDF